MSNFETDLELIRQHDEYLRNDFFNKQLDSRDLGEIGLTYYHHDGESFDLENFSLALFYGDNATYRLLISQLKDQHKFKVLRTESFPGNELTLMILMITPTSAIFR